MACGLAAGLVQAVVTDTANQCIQIKMVHDQSPRGPQRYRGFVHAVRCIHAEEGIVRGFYAGIVPAIANGATTNCLPFLGFGVITPEMRRLQPAASAGPPPAAHQTMLAGGVAGYSSLLRAEKAGEFLVAYETSKSPTWGHSDIGVTLLRFTL